MFTPAANIIVKERKTRAPVPPIPNTYNLAMILNVYKLKWCTRTVGTPPFDDIRENDESDNCINHIGDTKS